MPYLLFLMCAFVWSGSFILMKKATLGFTPMEVGAWRCVWGAVVLGVLCWRQRLLIRPTRAQWFFIGAVTLIGCAWPYTIQPLVVARQGSAFMALVVSFVPMATILISLPLLRIRPTARQVVGVCGALICLGLLLADGISRRIAIGDFAWAATVPIGYALGNTIIRGWLRDLPSLPLTLYLLASTSVILLPLSQFQSSPAAASTGTWWLAWGALAILGVLGTGLATYWFNQLVREHGPLFAGMTTNLVPIGAVLWGWVDQEDISPRQCVALAGIVVMVALVQFGAARSTKM